YTILETLGTGNFGTVFKGIHNESKQIVVVRQIELGGSKDRALKIQQDIELMSQCKSKHLLRYQECFVNDDTLWIIIEYVNGTSCKDLLKASTMSEGNIAAICRELITGLDCLHSEEKIHQNVKASNVIVTSLGEVKLTDGGISSSLLVNPRQTIVGTPFWTAPEAIRQAEFGAKSDIWSLGITAIELAKGEPPLADYHPMRVMFLIPKAKPPSLDGDFSDAFKDFVALCLRKEPDNRPSAKELLQHSFIKNAPTTRRLRELLEPSQLYLGRPPERIQKYDMGSSHSSGLKPIKAVRTDSPERETYGCRPATPISFQNPITERSTEGTLRWNSPKAVDADMHTDGTNDAALVEMTRVSTKMPFTLSSPE
ncbi:kinase-like protein, partial [Rickenella mellea]